MPHVLFNHELALIYSQRLRRSAVGRRAHIVSTLDGVRAL